MSDKDLNDTSRTNWAALELMKDGDIDYSDITSLTNDFFEKATLRIPVAQAHQLVQIDSDVVYCLLRNLSVRPEFED